MMGQTTFLKIMLVYKAKTLLLFVLQVVHEVMADLVGLHATYNVLVLSSARRLVNLLMLSIIKQVQSSS